MLLLQASAGCLALKKSALRVESDNIDYWATLCAPWSRSPIMLILESNPKAVLDDEGDASVSTDKVKEE